MLIVYFFDKMNQGQSKSIILLYNVVLIIGMLLGSSNAKADQHEGLYYAVMFEASKEKSRPTFEDMWNKATRDNEKERIRMEAAGELDWLENTALLTAYVFLMFMGSLLIGAAFNKPAIPKIIVIIVFSVFMYYYVVLEPIMVLFAAFFSILAFTMFNSDEFDDGDKFIDKDQALKEMHRPPIHHTKSALKAMKKAHLIAYGKKYGITLNDDYTKKQMIDIIQKFYDQK
jgi:hypothetical protein